MIRFKVFIPAFLLVVLVAFVVLYRIDAWVKGWIEDGISAITDTKTDIRSLTISFKNSSLTIDRLEIASKNDEWKNLLEFEDIVVDFQALPLLRKRVVVDDFSLKGIQWGTKRRTSGRLPPRKKSKEPSWFSEQLDVAMGSLKKEMAKTPVSKWTNFSLPDSPRELLKEFNLESEKVFMAMVDTSQKLRGEWVERYKAFRDISEYQRRAREVKALTSNPPQDPQAIVSALQTARELQTFFEDEKKKVDELMGAARSDYSRVKADYDKAEAALKADIERAQRLVGLEDLQVSNLSRLLFGDVWIQRAEEVLRFHAKLRRFMTASSPDPKVEVKQRAKGRDIIFVTEKKQPSFVWAKSEFSVKGLQDGDRKVVNQLYQLKVRDVNSNPKLYGKPTLVALKAELKDSLLERASFTADLNYTEAVDRERFKTSVEGIKIEAWPVGIPRLFPVRLGEGMLASDSDLRFEGSDFSWATKVSFANVRWDFSEVPNKGILVPILQDIFKGVNDFFLTITMKLNDKDLGFSVESNMDALVKQGIEAQLKKKLSDLQARLQREIENRLDVYKKKSLDELDRFSSDVQAKANELQSLLDAQVREVKKLEADLKARSQRAVESKVGEGLQNLQKKLPSVPNLFHR